MTIEETLKKAIEGGWDEGRSIVGDAWKGLSMKSTHKAFLDPLFWKSLGKAMGWLDVTRVPKGHVCSKCCEWLDNWHRFINHLASGGEIEEFFS